MGEIKEKEEIWRERQCELANSGGRKVYVNFLVDRFLHDPVEENKGTPLGIWCYNFTWNVLKKIRFLDF
jgi:hypothetical protein